MTTCDKAQRTLDWYTERFKREYRDAQVEYDRLTQQFKDVCWYNFETRCVEWKRPWRSSDPESRVEVYGMSFHRTWRRGHLVEHARFPVWYDGPVCDAPYLPPSIIATEVEEARRYMEACRTQLTAPYDWAPGGILYEALRRTTAVGCQ